MTILEQEGGGKYEESLKKVNDRRKLYSVNEKEIEEKVNEWDIIDTYFRDNRYYKSQHQVDSYDEFITSDKTGIIHIITRDNPMTLYKEPINADKSKFKYEIKIYFGEILDDKGEIVKTQNKNIYMSSPIIYDDDKDIKYMYPNDARIRGFTYASNVFCNIGIVYIIDGGETIEVRNYKKINIGQIPIMLHSKQCLLRDMDGLTLSKFGECPYDQGGYFVINGKEKVILSQEKKVDNILYIYDSPEDDIEIQAVIKTKSTEGLQSSRTNMITLNKFNHKLVKKGNDYVQKTSFQETVQYSDYKTMVRILGLDIKVPLFILFRSLGVLNDREIYSYIIYESDSEELKRLLGRYLHSSQKDGVPIYSQKEAFKLLAINTKGKEIINVIDILTNNFLPSYKEDYNMKSQYLGYVVRKLLMTQIGIYKKTDR